MRGEEWKNNKQEKTLLGASVIIVILFSLGWLRCCVLFVKAMAMNGLAKVAALFLLLVYFRKKCYEL